jgi:soluble lytic murein transglycosylase
MKRILFPLLVLLITLPAYGGSGNGKEYLGKGKKSLDEGDYRDAVFNLSLAVEEYSLLGDYALLWLADAYHAQDAHGKSLKTIRKLLDDYPRSPLIQRARIREIEEAVHTSANNLETLYQSYLKRYPKDEEMRYIYAKWQKNRGNTDVAYGLFKRIYLDAGPFAGSAYRAVDHMQLQPEEMLERASNLMKRLQYQTAERTLREGLTHDESAGNREMLKKLGYTLFAQKKYHEAAGVYRKVHDRYWEIRSLYRAGERETVQGLEDEMLEKGDRRMASILLALAADMRRDGDTEKGIGMYRKIMEEYPVKKEDALWGIAWTRFLNGDYPDASDIFGKLYRSYGDKKYQYWHVRSREHEEKGKPEDYLALIDIRKDFYGVLADGKTKTRRCDAPQTKVSMNPVPKELLHKGIQKNNRIEALLELGFSKEGLLELEHAAKSPTSVAEILYFCAKFYELGEFGQLVRLSYKLPDSKEKHFYRYPLAYWETIEKLSKRYHVDPYLVLAVIREESRFDARAKSPAGALGLMQLMPATAKRFDGSLGVGIRRTNDILQVSKNLHIGIYYLGLLVKEFGSYTRAVAAYNAGEEAVRRWQKKGGYQSFDVFVEDIPYYETKKYVKRVIASFFEYKRYENGGDGACGLPFEKL